jgi:hypothetical protein
MLKKYPLLILFMLAIQASLMAQTNLLQNPDAAQHAEHWRAHGAASIEYTTDGNLCFVVRNGGSFTQDVAIAPEQIGQYALLIGRASSERIDPDGAITDLPYLYGYMMGPPDEKKRTIFEYLQGQRMRSHAKTPDEWVTLWGIFKIPKRINQIKFFLNQAERRHVPRNGSAARFKKLGLYIFSDESKARAFASTYN